MRSPEPEAMSRAGKGTAASTDAGNSQPLPWSEVAKRFAKGGWFWLATVRSDGAPHLVPLMAAWSDPVLYIVSNPKAQKTRNLAVEDRCVLSTDAGDVHLVIEGRARQVRDDAGLTKASQAFDKVWGWPTRVIEGMLDADFGAPTSGGPPYLVFEITPAKAFSFPTDGESTTPTRWRFEA